MKNNLKNWRWWIAVIALYPLLLVALLFMFASFVFLMIGEFFLAASDAIEGFRWKWAQDRLTELSLWIGGDKK